VKATKRIVTGLLLAGFVLGLIWADHALGSALATSALIIFLCATALHELCGVLAGAGYQVHRRLAVAALVVMLSARAAAAPLGLSGGEARELSLVVLAFAIVAPLALGIARPPEDGAPGSADITRTAVTAFALAYIALLGSFLLELRMLEGEGEGDVDHGLRLCLLLAASVKVGDSCAYFVGRAIGRHKMCWVSPNKSWEGAVASLAGSMAVSVGLGAALDYDVRLMAGFGAVIGLAGQGGDLIESYVKRAVGVKDSARTFGEIGGALDMLDALLLAAPAGYLWARLLIVA